MELSHKAAASNLDASKMAFLPNLNASGGQNWNFGRTQGQSGLYENQTQSNTSLSVGTSVPLFQGGYLLNSVSKSKLDLQAAFLNIEKAKNDISLQVTSLFFQVLFQKEILKIAQEQFHTTQQQVAATAILVESGKVSQSQWFDISSQAAKDTLDVVQASGNLKLSLLDLAQALELQDIEDFDIESPEIHASANDGENANSTIRSFESLRLSDIYNQAVGAMPEVKSQELSVKSAEKSLKIAQSAYYPSISLSAGIGTNYFYLYNNNLQNLTFKKQMNLNLGKYIGLNLNIPIFNRLSVLNQTNQAKFNIENQKLILENTKKQLYKDIQTAYINANLAQEKQSAATQAVRAAQEAFRYATERYASGKLSVFEYSQSQAQLSQAQSEEAQAKYDYMLKIKILEFYTQQ